MSLFDDEKIRILLSSIGAKEHLKKYAQTTAPTISLVNSLISNLEQKMLKVGIKPATEAPKIVK